MTLSMEKKFRLKSILRSEEFAFLIASLIAYGIFIPWFSLYGDDWIYLYAYHLQGPGIFIDFVAPDRPLSAWIYILTTFLFKETYWLYHLLLFVLRWLSGVILFRVLLEIWPQHREKVFWTSLLFLVFPGFLQQPIAIQFILHFTVLDLFLLSLWGMIYSIKIKQKYWLFTILSLLAASGMFSLEYFFGLELLRPLFIWMALGKRFDSTRQKVLRVFWIWLPYLLLMGAFLFWRIFIFSFKHYQPVLLNELVKNPSETIKSLLLTILDHLRLAVYGAWRQIFQAPTDLEKPLVFLSLVTAALILSLWYAKFRYKSPSIQKPDEEGSFKSWFSEALLIGGVSLIIGGIPIWIVGLPVSLSFPWDRSILPYMLGSSLILTAGVFGFLQTRFQRILLALIFAFSIGFHFRNAMVYIGEAQSLQSFFWQLTWRVPDLRHGTIVLSDRIPLFRFSDNGLTPVLNWTYAPGLKSTEIPYKLFELTGRLEEGMPLLKKGVKVSHPYRSIRFSGNTSNSLVVYYSPPSCLRVLDSEDAAIPGLPDNIINALDISNLDQVMIDSSIQAEPPNAIGAEPEHDWCYYFQKSDLARQQKNWVKILEYWNSAVENKQSPEDPTELFPFIEGFVNLGDLDKALDLSEIALENGEYSKSFCEFWSSMISEREFSELDLEKISSLRDQLGCNN